MCKQQKIIPGRNTQIRISSGMAKNSTSVVKLNDRDNYLNIRAASPRNIDKQIKTNVLQNIEKKRPPPIPKKKLPTCKALFVLFLILGL